MKVNMRSGSQLKAALYENFAQANTYIWLKKTKTNTLFHGKAKSIYLNIYQKTFINN